MSICSVELEGLLLPLPPADCGRSRSAKSTKRRGGSSPGRGPACPAIQTCEPSTGGSIEAPFFSQPEFLASPQAVPGSREARAMTVGSGRRLLTCSMPSGPLGECLRILLESKTWGSTEFFLTWSGGATKRGRCVFQLVPSMPRIDECAIGSSAAVWPTLDASDAGKTSRSGNRIDEPLIGGLVRALPAAWPTLHGMDNEGNARRNGPTGNELGRVCNTAAWPTLTAWDDKGQTQNPERMDYVPNIVKANGTVSSGSLAQTGSFVGRLMTLSAWLMGYTVGYCALWETALSRKSRRKSSGRSAKRQDTSTQ
jgi:hypothetical protein